jgi:hypothetical protein
MKTFLLTCVACFGLAMSVFSQKAVMTDGKVELVKSKTSGTYNFTFPDDTDTEEIKTVAGYYTEYFTVNYEEDSKKAEIVLVENTEINRRIITRFLSSSNIETVVVDGAKFTIDQFLETYLL